MLKEKLMADLKVAMKEKNTVMKSVITMIRADIKQYEVDNRVDADEEKIISIIAKQLKQRRDAIEEFRKGDREDLIAQTEAEIGYIKGYLPEELSEDEVKEIVLAAIAEVGAEGMKDMKKVMPVVMSKTKGRADGKLVSEIVKKSLI